MKYILMLAVCAIMTACGGSNLDSYKNTMLESLAKQLGTTKDLLVKDLDINIDSMSVSFMSLQDSIDFVNLNYEKKRKPLDESIAFEKERISKLSEEYEKKKNGNNYGFLSILKQNINDAKYKLAKAENKLTILTEDYELSVSKFENRNPEDIVHHVFTYRIALKNPLKQIHEVASAMSFFSPDGKRFITEVKGPLYDFMIERKKEK